MPQTYFSPRDIKALREYKYSSIDKSLLSRYVLNPYWNWLVTLFPLWMAPNLITLLGLTCVGINVGLVMWYDWTLEGNAPGWVYISCGIGLFVYQSLDAIDGKQARRTKTSGPLGELFDHGCDALNTLLAGFLTLSALGLGSGWMSVVSLCSAMTNFYGSTWEEYYTGTLYLSVVSGPVEGVVMIVGVVVMAGVYGPGIYRYPLDKFLTKIGLGTVTTYLPAFISSTSLNRLLTVLGGVILAFNIMSCGYNVYTHTHTPKPNPKTPTPTTKATHVKPNPVMTFLPYPTFLLLLILHLSLSPRLLSHYFLPYFVALTPAFGRLVGEIITSHLCGRALSPFRTIWMDGFLAVWGVAIAAGVGGVSEGVVCMVMVPCGVAMYAKWAVKVISAYEEVFEVGCLTIRHASNEGKDQ
ncbi:hypothetical protein HDU85_000796 [Gaertneriomyces sp. JEL0708]|nr:hypothetical protein HDU85_000796 [Gaertneriomyces sp. JEL0708]